MISKALQETRKGSQMNTVKMAICEQSLKKTTSLSKSSSV